MPSTHTMPLSGIAPQTEHQVVHSIQSTLRILFGVIPIVAGIDKFTNVLATWTDYLNPFLLRMVPVSDFAFMHVVGVIEIIAGLLVLTKPKLCGLIVTAWLVAIALQLLLWGHFLDVAVRDLAMAIGGSFTLARLTPFTNGRNE